MNKSIKIFLSYAHEDIDKVLEVYQRLKQEKFKPWLDKEDLLPGQRWEQEIPKAIREADFVLLFFSKTSLSKRGYVQKEFKLALDILNEIPQGKIFIIPARLDDCKIPQSLQFLHYCDLFEKDGIEKIIKAIRHEEYITEMVKPAFQPGMDSTYISEWIASRKEAVRHYLWKRWELRSGELEEVLQLTNLAALQAFEKYDWQNKKAEPGTYLIGIAKIIAQTYLRRKERELRRKK